MARPPKLELDEVAAALRAPDGPQWELVGGRLVRTVTLPGFPAALDYVIAVGRLAEEADHHPDIDIRYRQVTLALSTHDAGGITQLDLDLAHQIDELKGPLPEPSPS